MGLSTAKDHLKAAKEAVAQARMHIDQDRIDLGLVFSSIEFVHPIVPRTIAGLLGQIPIIGCSSLAVISGQGLAKHGLLVILLSLPQDVHCHTAVVREISAKSSLNAGEELGEKLLSGFKGVRRDLSIVFSDGLIQAGSGLVFGLQEKLGRSFPLAGASASDNLVFQKTYVYSNEEILSDAACAVLLGGKLTFGLGVKHGWKPLGKPRRVTKSKGNIVNEIDHSPAVKLYEEYFAKDISELKKDLKRISIFYPLGIYLAGEQEYLLRNILSIEEDGAVVFQGDVPQDSLTRLMIGTQESCLAATQQAAEEVNAGLAGHKCNFALVFDSISRYMLLGRQANKELEIIKSVLGEKTALVGLYTYGEQAPLKAIKYLGRTYFHNQTVTIMGIGG